MTTLTPAPTTVGSGGMIPVPIPRAPVGSGAASGALTGADFIRIVRQRLVLIIFVWLFLVACTVVGTELAVRYYPKYRATAYIQVQSITPANPLDPLRPQEARQEEILRLLQDQAIAVKTPQVIENAVKDPEVRNTLWFREAEANTKEDARDLLSDIISAEPIRDSNYLAVSASWKIQSEVPVLVNKVVEKYMTMIEVQQKQRIRRADDQLGDELSRAKGHLDSKLKEIEDFRVSEEVLGTSREELAEKLKTLTAIETELNLDWSGKKALYEMLRDIRPEELPITPELQAILNADPNIARLEQAYQYADEQLSEARSKYGENHRIVRHYLHARNSAADRVIQERAVKTMQYQTDQIDQSRRNYLESQQMLFEIRELLHEARVEQQDKDQKYAGYLRMQEEADLLKSQYEQLLEQKNIITMTLRQDRTVQINVQSGAVLPNRRSSPRYEIWIPFGTLLGLGLAVGLALLLELADKSVRTPRDLQRQQIPVLATIPNTDDDEIEITRVETAALDAPHSITAEAFRNLRANLFFSAPAEQQATILVTSPSAANGKTTVAVNLAISIALSGRRVLLVDANFRRPNLPRLFPEMPDTGLSNILIGQAHLDDVVRSTSVPGLDVLAAGPPPPNPAELLGSSYLHEMLVDARARYDQIIFDGPPVLLVSDAMVLAGAVDGVLLVCQYRTTSRGALQRTQQQLEAIGARIFGAVLNKVETRAGGYFRKAYREFYEYHETPEEQEEGSERKRLKADEEAQKLHDDQEGPSAKPGGGEGEEQASEALPSDELQSVGFEEEASVGEQRDGGASADASRSVDELDVMDEVDVMDDVDIDAEIENLGGEQIISDEDLGEERTPGDEDFGLPDHSDETDRPGDPDKPQ